MTVKLWLIVNLWGRNSGIGQLMSIFIFLKCFRENSWLFTSQHLVCCGSTQRGHTLGSQCLLKTSPESSWHRQDTAALSTCASLSLSPWSFFHDLLLSPHSLCLFLSHLSSHHLALPCLSTLVTSLLLLIFLAPLSHSCASLCSQRSVVEDTWMLCSGPLFAVLVDSCYVWCLCEIQGLVTGNRQWLVIGWWHVFCPVWLLLAFLLPFLVIEEPCFTTLYPLFSIILLFFV